MALNNVQKLLSVLLAPIQALEAVAWDVINLRILDNASGDGLDQLGAIVGESRDARSDTDYRAAIRIRIRVNRSQGKAEDVIAVATLAAVNSTPAYTESYPAGWEVVINNLPGGLQIARLLGLTKAAGTAGILSYTDSASAGMRWVNDGDTPAADQVWSDDTAPTTNYRIDLGAGGT